MGTEFESFDSLGFEAFVENDFQVRNEAPPPPPPLLSIVFVNILWFGYHTGNFRVDYETDIGIFRAANFAHPGQIAAGAMNYSLPDITPTITEAILPTGVPAPTDVIDFAEGSIPPTNDEAVDFTGAMIARLPSFSHINVKITHPPEPIFAGPNWVPYFQAMADAIRVMLGQRYGTARVIVVQVDVVGGGRWIQTMNQRLAVLGLIP